MKQYIINVPQLQSIPKRLSSFAITILCWVMWGYLLYPIVTLINWLRGDYNVINEMRWFGGYKSLLELLEIYIFTLFILGVMWIIWILIRKFRHSRQSFITEHTVTDADLCAFYHVDKEQLLTYRNQQNVTVFFDEHGKIIDLKTTLP